MDAHETMMNARGKNARETKGQKKKESNNKKRVIVGGVYIPCFRLYV